MALTPEDVVNKRFQPTKFREGYDQDEVDDFLDEIVVELRRLHQENEELRRKVSDGSSSAPTVDAAASASTSQSTADTAHATAVPAPVSASTLTENLSDETVAAQTVTDEPNPASAPDAPATVDAPAESTSSAVSSAPSVSAESAAGVLTMAQRLHDEYVNAGVEQRDKIIAEAQTEANGLVNDAQEKSRKTLGELEQQKTVLERKVEQLRGFERDYRSRLKAYIEGQLRDLDARGSIASDTAAS